MYSRLPKIDTPKIDTFYEIPRDFEKHNTLFGLYKTSTFILKIKYHSSPSESLHANLSKRSQRLRICSFRISSTFVQIGKMSLDFAVIFLPSKFDWIVPN